MAAFAVLTLGPSVRMSLTIDLHKRATLTLLALAIGALALPSSAVAFVVPVNDVDDFVFPSGSSPLQVMSVSVRMHQEEGRLWHVDAEVWLRNTSGSAVDARLAGVLSDDMGVWVNGAPVIGTIGPLQRDPAYSLLNFPNALVFTAPMPAESTHLIRVSGLVEARVDAVGQIFLELPSYALGVFEGDVRSGTMHAWFEARPLGVQSSINNYTVYDQPENQVSWRLAAWEPLVPFRLSYLPPWSALLLATSVEECPEPWDVVRSMTSGNINTVRAYLSTFDNATLQFCSSLPLVIHGFVFESDRAREQFSAVPMSRYLPDRAAAGAFYIENPAFTEEMLSDAEAIYRNTLRQLSEAPQ
jgi:hypothetical protein